MKKKTVWFDFENSPHPLVLFPVVKELRKKGYGVFFTVRDVAQTVGIMKNSGENFIVVDRGYSQLWITKRINTFLRAIHLLWVIRDKEIACCVSCSSRSALLAGWISSAPFLSSLSKIFFSRKNKIPTVAIYDYEFVNSFCQNKFADIVLMPDLITARVALKAGLNLRNLIHFQGLKEYFYLHDYKPGQDPFSKFQASQGKIKIALRSPAVKAHYRSKRSLFLYNKVLEFLKNKQGAFVLVFPRYKFQTEQIKENLKDAKCNYAISEKIPYGPDVIYYSDVFFGDGGTMLREAAVLGGTPSYSFFSDREGAVDRYLRQRGRFRLIRNREDLDKIEIAPKKELRLNLLSSSDSGLKKIIECIEKLSNNGKIKDA